jgi:hypothetical protein
MHDSAASPKPYLLLDIDGVLSPFGAGPPPGFTRQTFGEYEVVWSVQHREWLSQLASFFELVWATTWEHSANEAMSPVLGLPALPVIEFERGTGDTWKLPSVRQFVAGRPTAWIDDDLYLDAFTWARDRAEPTLLVRTSSSVGMVQHQFEELLAFADSVG